MPNQTNLTVKKNDGTTDIVWTAVVPSAGDRSSAKWESQTVGSAMSHRPYMTLVSRDNGPNTARRLEGQVVFPVLVTDAGVTRVVDKLIFDISAVIAKGAPAVDVNEAVSQTFNLFDHADVVACFKAGYAPN